MKNSFLILIALAFLFVGCKKTDKKASFRQDSVEVNERIISLNGTVSEVLVALGKEKSIIGVDMRSTYPNTLKKNSQDLGSVRSLSIETLLSLRPTKIYATNNDLSEDQLKQFDHTDAKMEMMNQEFTIEGTKALIKSIATSLGVKNYDIMLKKIDSDLEHVKPLANKPRVLFIYAGKTGDLMVSGKATPIDEIIRIAGGENAVKGFEGFKPLTPEAIVSENPDYILLYDTVLESMGGVDGVLKTKGLKSTNAGQNRRVIAMDALLLVGFGPRVGEAATELNRLIQQ